MTTTTEYPLAVIEAAILAIAKTYDGMAGTCAQFAKVLNDVLGGEGDYVIVDSGHYQFADHVAVRIDGVIFDAEGMHEDEEGFLERWTEEEGDQTLEEFDDPTGDQVLRLADPTCWGGEGIDMEQMAMDLRQSLQEAAQRHSPASRRP